MGFFVKQESNIKIFIASLPDESENSHYTIIGNYLTRLIRNSDEYDTEAKTIIGWQGHHFENLISGQRDDESTRKLLTFLALVAYERHARTHKLAQPEEHQILFMYVNRDPLLDKGEIFDFALVKDSINREVSQELINDEKGNTEKTVLTIGEKIEKYRETVEKLTDQAIGWKEYLDAHQDRLNDIKSNYSFVGLSQGFNKIELSKRKSRGVVLRVRPKS